MYWHKVLSLVSLKEFYSAANLGNPKGLAL